MNNSTVNKLFNINSFFGGFSKLAFSTILKFLVQIVIAIVFSKKLSLNEYAAYQYLWMYVNVFSVLGLFGVSSLVLSSSLGEILQWAKKNKYYIVSFVIIVNLIAILVILFGNYTLSLLDKLLMFSLLLCQNFSLLLESICIKNKNLKKLFYVNLAYIVLYTAVHFYSIYTSYTLTILLIGIVAATILKCIFLFSEFKINNKVIHEHNKSIGNQWFYLGINDTIAVLVKWIDKWIVLAILPATQFAIYFNGTFEIPIFLLLLSVIGNISIVELSKTKEINVTDLKLIFEKSSILLASIIFPSFWFLIYYCNDIFMILFANKYAQSIPIFKVSLLILPLRIVYSTAVLQLQNKTNLIVRGAILDFLLTIIFILILYPIWQLKGLAFAFVAATFIQITYYLWCTSKLLQKKIFYFFPIKKILILFTISFCSIYIANFLSLNSNTMTRIFLGTIICTILVSILLIIFYKNLRKVTTTQN
ncbi:MAG: hypothetical protein HOO89_05535 [Ferruginibacter sp.]|nr:hypothetical protein [Ferruginibacter sp.]